MDKITKRTSIIAEIGFNHCGDMSLAKEMIISAASSGADIVKFQVWSVDNLKNGPWDTDGRRELYVQSQLTKDKILDLYSFCLEHKIRFLVSVFNKKDLDLLPNYYTDIIKIPSTEIDNIDLIKECNRRFREVIVSTGSSLMEEVDKAYNICPKSCFMHCVNMYPCPFEYANIKRIHLLKQKYNNIGYSDHTLGISALIYAISHNCTYVEKHFTINRDLPGRDNKFSILPDDLQNICSIRDQIYTMTQQHSENYLSGEEEMRKTYRGRWGR